MAMVSEIIPMDMRETLVQMREDNLSSIDWVVETRTATAGLTLPKTG
tara:strand:+ start:335 stop:475 length:141 start_codon:yes stop_codon:yes gene_type:complete